MNQQQRNFLIKKIEEGVNNKIKALALSKPEPPSLNVYLLHAVMSGNFQLRSIDEMKETLRQKALRSKEREDWMGNSWGSSNKSGVNFRADEIFVIPEEYRKLADQHQKETSEIEQQIHNLRTQSEGLITRIQLASDKTLQKMINEVDDMGDISLMDTKLKLLQ